MDLIFGTPVGLAFVIGGLIALLVFAAVYGRRHTNKNWKAACERMGVRYVPDSRAFAATCEGVPVYVDTIRSSGDPPISTRFRAAAPPGPLQVHVYERRGTGLARLLHVLDEIPIGDPAFDQAWVVESNDAAAARRLIHPELRARLDRLRGQTQGHYSFQLDEQGVTVMRDALERDAASLVLAVFATAALARAAIGFVEVVA